MKLSFFSSCFFLVLVLATPSFLVVAKKEKKTKNTKNKNILGSGNFNYDPMSKMDSCPDTDCRSSVCGDSNCASDMWKDGCLTFMCYNQGNTSWCVMILEVFTMIITLRNMERTHFFDSNRSNRKCNTDFFQQDVKCYRDWDWECERGLFCSSRCLNPYISP